MREVATEERAELGLGEHEPLDPYQLARQHAIPIYTISELLEHDLDPGTHEHFHQKSTGSWSAALIPFGTARVIVENDAHAEVRRRTNIAHEIGHYLLEHSFEDVILGEDHKRQFDKTQEKQALFISGELLIPERAARKAAFANWDNSRVAQAYNVSEQFAQMRMMGARVIAQRATTKYRGKV